MKTKALNFLVLMILLVGGSFVLVGPEIPKAHAVGPAVAHTCVSGNTPASSIGCNLQVTKGDLIVVIGSSWNSGGCTSLTGLGLTTSGGETFTRDADSTCINNAQPIANAKTEVWSWSAIAAETTGALTLTTHYASSTSEIYIGAYDVTGAQDVLLATLTGTGTVTTNGTFSSAGTFDYGTAVVMGAIITRSAPTPYTLGAGTGYTLLQCTPSSCGVAAELGALADQYTVSGTVAGPTNFPWKVTTFGSQASTWVTFAVAYGTSAPTVTVVTACNFFQLQCWMYPMFFMGTYLGFFIGLAAAAEVSEKAFLYLLLSGATIASLIEVDMGIMTAMIPVILITLNIVYSFRLDQRIINAVTSGKGGTST